MANFPAITIITPSFNQSDFLEAAIRSVFDQGYPNLEYIIVDGASTDGSQEIIQKYSDQLSWWVSEPDFGQADAINKGLRRASGEIIGWLNSDDLYLRNALQKVMAAFSKKPEIDLFFSNVLSIDQNSKIINTMRYGDWGLNDLTQFKIIGQPGVFLRKSLMDRVGFLDETYRFLLDHQYWLRLALNADICHIDDFWAAARYHPAAKNISQAEKFGLEAFRIVEWMENEPAFNSILQKNKKRIYAGAYNFNARYLLDSGKPAQAFWNYLKSFARDPVRNMEDFRRIVYSLVNIFLPISTLRGRFIKQRNDRQNLAQFEPLLPTMPKENIEGTKTT